MSGSNALARVTLSPCKQALTKSVVQLFHMDIKFAGALKREAKLIQS